VKEGRVSRDPPAGLAGKVILAFLDRSLVVDYLDHRELLDCPDFLEILELPVLINVSLSVCLSVRLGL